MAMEECTRNSILEETIGRILVHALERNLQSGTHVLCPPRRPAHCFLATPEATAARIDRAIEGLLRDGILREKPDGMLDLA